jgi:hypothetical protein
MYDTAPCLIKWCFRFVSLMFPEGKRPMGRPRRRWEDNIKMDLQEVGGLWGLIRVGSG